jgi:G3E family GTPase
VDLLVDQLEFANVIVLNKIDLVSKQDLDKARGLIKQFNHDAKLIECNFSAIDINEVIDTGLFNIEHAKLTPGSLNLMFGFLDDYSQQAGLIVLKMDTLQRHLSMASTASFTVDAGRSTQFGLICLSPFCTCHSSCMKNSQALGGIAGSARRRCSACP